MTPAPAKPRRRRQKQAPAPVIRRRVYTGARIHRVALAIGYLFCLWVGARVSWAASVAVTEQAFAVGQAVREALVERPPEPLIYEPDPDQL